MNVSFTPGDGNGYLLAAGLGAIVGVMFGGWVMSTLHKLMMGMVKVALLGAVMVIGVVLWKGYQAAHAPQAEQVDTHRPRTSYRSSYRRPAKRSDSPSAPNTRWWDQR